MAEVPSRCEKLLASARLALTEAAMQDTAGDKLAAFQSYKRGVLDMSEAAESTNSRRFRAEILEKLRPYLERTEQLMRECPELTDRLKKYEEDVKQRKSAQGRRT